MKAWKFTAWPEVEPLMADPEAWEWVSDLVEAWWYVPDWGWAWQFKSWSFHVTKWRDGVTCEQIEEAWQKASKEKEQ